MIESIFREMFPKDEYKIFYMVEDIKKNKIVDRFFTKELLDYRDALQEEVRVYCPNAEANCKIGTSSHQIESSEFIVANKPGARHRHEEEPTYAPAPTRRTLTPNDSSWDLNTNWSLFIGVSKNDHGSMEPLEISKYSHPAGARSNINPWSQKCTLTHNFHAKYE